MAIKPTFVGVGGMKCASTWVTECLRQHPEVLHSNPKETAYFNTHTGLTGYQRFFDQATSSPGVEAAPGSSYKAVGEFTPTYLPNAAIASRRIHATLGPVQILAILRDPVKRYLSHYKWVLGRREDMDRARFANLDLAAFASANEAEPRMLEFGHYRDDLQVYLDRFGPDNVHLMLFEDVATDAQALLRGLYEFLGVDPSFVPAAIDEKVREGYVPRSAALEWAKVKAYFLVKNNAPWAIEPLKQMQLEKLLRRVNTAKQQPLVVAPEVTQALRDHYAEEIERMRVLLGRPVWGA